MKHRALRAAPRPLLSPIFVSAWCCFTAFACSEAGSTQAPFSDGGASSGPATGGSGAVAGGASIATGGAPSSGGGAGSGGAGSSAGGSLGGSPIGLGATGGMPTLASGGGSSGGSVVSQGGSSGGGATSAGHAGIAGSGTGGSGPSAGGAPDSGGSGGAAPAGTFQQVAALLGKSCATMSSCHGTGSAQTAFTGSKLYETLMSKRGIPYCDDAPLVVPNEPTQSALYKVIGGHCGTFVMPPFTACKTMYCPTEEDWNMIGGWIARGAPND